MEIAEDFIHSQLSNQQISLIPTTLKQAYDVAKAIADEEPIFQIPSAQFNRGRIIQWSVEFYFERLVRSKHWPFKCNWATFGNNNGRYLEIHTGDAILTICQTALHDKQPRDAKFRSNLRLSGQGDLFYNYDFLDEKEIRPAHILLLHGHQSLNFSYLAIPKPAHHAGFLYKSSNLMLMPHGVTESVSPVVNTDMDIVLELKDEIVKWHYDNEKNE